MCHLASPIPQTYHQKMRQRRPKEVRVPDTVNGVLEELTRAFGAPRLTVELLPSSTWGSNLRSALRVSHWDKLRRGAYAAANHRCEICGGVGHQYRVACHERWEFDDAQSCQRLVGLIALCPECHDVKHFGRANENGRGPDATLHLCEVNDWSIGDANRYVELHFALWKLRTRKEWCLDLAWLAQFGIVPKARDLSSSSDSPRGE